MQIPIFWNRFADYNFYFWHPGVAVAPPAADSPLGPKDSAMLAVLEASVPAINQQIAASILQSRNAPPPEPPDPDSKRFWRVKVDWSLDTDQDGSPDWAEFEIAALGAGLLVPGVTGDAFNEDTNNDGIPDGLQLDSDGDGTPDGIDINPSDNTATFPIGQAPRYALFPITNAQPTSEWPSPFQISDKGTVLYDNGTWTAGVWTALDFPSGTGLTQTKALGINDTNQIIGAGSRDITSNFGEPDEICGICYWSDPHGVRTFVSSGNGTAEKYAVATHEFYSRQLSPGPVLSNDGHFSAFTKPKADHAWIMPSPGYWKLPTGIQPATEASGDHRLEYSQVPNLRWGAGYSLGLYSTMQFSGFGGPEDESKPLERLVHAPNLLPAPPFTAINVFTPTPDLVLALPAATSADDGMAFVKGKWVASATYAKAIDIATDGTAIGKAHDNLTAPICINGKWTGIERTAPGITAAWRDETIKLLDTTLGGWILAQRGSGSEANPEQSAVMLPIRVDGVDPDLVPPPLPPAPGTQPFDPPEYLAGGVDHTSMAATGGGGRIPQIWIMAPTAVNKSVRFQSPLNTVSSLSIPSSDSLVFTPEVTTSNDQVIQIKASFNNGSISPVLKLGGTVKSLSSPVMIKVMKKRTIKVAVHPVALKQGSDDAIYPSRIPSNSVEDRNDFKEKLTEYLDKVYGQQVNAFFNIGVMPAVEVDFDTVAPAGEVAVPAGNDFSQEMTIACTNPQWPSGVADIDIWILGGTVLKDGPQQLLGSKIGGTYGDPPKLTPSIIVDGSDSVGRIIAHEIGHIFMGGGHPDAPTQPYFARLTGISQEQRLMKEKESDHSKCQLIKKEWDKIEQWLEANIKDEEE